MSGNITCLSFCLPSRLYFLCTCAYVHICRYPFTPDQPIQAPDWERYCGTIVTDITTDQSPKQLLSVRAKLYQLLMNCIPASVIVKVWWGHARCTKKK